MRRLSISLFFFFLSLSFTLYYYQTRIYFYYRLHRSCYVYTCIEFQLSIARMYSRASPRVLPFYLFSNWKNIRASTTRDLFLKDTNMVAETRYGFAVLSRVLDFGWPRDRDVSSPRISSLYVRENGSIVVRFSRKLLYPKRAALRFRAKAQNENTE